MDYSGEEFTIRNPGSYRVNALVCSSLGSLQWHHNERDGVSNHQPHDCLLKRLFTRRSKKTSKLRVTALYSGNSPVTGEFPAQRASNAENVSNWWRHHVIKLCCSRNAWRSRSYMFLVAESEVGWVLWYLISLALPLLVSPCCSTDYSGSQRKFIYSFYFRPDDAYQWWTGSLLIHVLTWHLFGAKP